MPENDVARVARPGATVFIKPKRARPFFGRHPWVLDSAILRVDGNPDSGAIVDVVTHDTDIFTPIGRKQKRFCFEKPSEEMEPLPINVDVIGI